MIYQHEVRYLRISQKKLKQVGKLVRGQTANDAIRNLKLQPQKGATFLAKAIAAAKNNAEQAGVKLEKMTISSIAAQKGPIFMRRWIRAKGRSTPKRKPTSHAVILFVDAQIKADKKPTTKRTEKVQEEK
jgi:large subunit ribosomal protein L22